MNAPSRSLAPDVCRASAPGLRDGTHAVWSHHERHADVPATGHGTPASAHPDVLVADDDPTVTSAIGGVLVEAGYSVHAVSTGAEALSAAAALHPRLLILDVSMPDIDGYRVCERLRSMPETSTIPVLFLSSSASLSARLSGLRAGAVDYLGKPAELAEVVAKVRAQLELVALRDALATRNLQLAAAHDALSASLESAGRVQVALLPRPLARDERVRFAWRCLQCEQLGGDSVNVLRLPDDRYAVYVLDASGHGVPASLLSVAAGYLVTSLLSGLSNRTMDSGPSPATILNELSRVLRSTAPSGSFVTMLIGVLDAAQESFTFSSAGHPGPLFLRDGSPPEFVDVPALPAGIGDALYTDSTLLLRPGDRVFLYSDGAFEQRNDAGVPFGRSRVAGSMAGDGPAAPGTAIGRLLCDLEHWRGDRQIEDDISVIGFQCLRAFAENET